MAGLSKERKIDMSSVLIIDDDKELCILMKKCVEHEGLSAIAANGGMARFITPLCNHKIIYDPDLLIRGLLILYRQNTGEA